MQALSVFRNDRKFRALLREMCDDVQDRSETTLSLRHCVVYNPVG